MQTSRNSSDPVLLMCALETCFTFVSLCLHSCMSEPSAQKALLDRTEIWQAGGPSRCPPLLCSPSCEDHVWHTGSGTKTSKTSWERGEKKEYWPILTQRQVERSTSKKIKACSVFEWMKKRRLYSFDDYKEKGRGSLSVFSVQACVQIKTKISPCLWGSLSVYKNMNYDKHINIICSFL